MASPTFPNLGVEQVQVDLHGIIGILQCIGILGR
jgi:hypothetical protein